MSKTARSGPRRDSRSSRGGGIASEFELVPHGEEFSFAVREFKLPAFPSPWHFHPECELTYILQSRGTRFVGDNISPYEPGDLVLIGPNVPHCWRNDTSDKNRRCLAHSLVIQFQEDCLGPGFLERPELLRVRELLQKARHGLQFTGGKTVGAVADLMLAMKHHQGLRQVIDLLEILGVLLDAGACRVLSNPAFEPLLDLRAGERIGRVCRYVLANLAEQLDFGRIAEEACMSQSALCHFFRRVTGRTLSDFINELRVGHARRLLVETADGIAQIAYASGFASLSNFNRRFRERSGVNPSEYRERYRAVGHG